MLIGINPLGALRDERNAIYYKHPVFSYPWDDIGCQIKRIYEPSDIDGIDVYYQLAYHEKHMKCIEYAINQGIGTIVHWLGVDVYRFVNNYFDIINGIDIHIVQSKYNKEEFAKMGVESFVNTETPPYPDKYFRTDLGKQITVHMPNILNYWYYDLMDEVVNKLPDCKFIFYGVRKGLRKLPDNCTIQLLIKEENKLIELLKLSRAHIRLTVHDGFPHSIIQHKLMGREVITNNDFPFCNRVSADTDSVISAIKNIPNKLVDIEGSNYYARRYRPEIFVNNFKDIYECL